MKTSSSEQSTQETGSRKGPRSSFSPAEQETVIRWDREDDTVHLFSADPTIWRRLERCGMVPTRVSTVKGAECGRFYVVPKAKFRFKPAGKAIRP